MRFYVGRKLSKAPLFRAFPLWKQPSPFSWHLVKAVVNSSRPRCTCFANVIHNNDVHRWFQTIQINWVKILKLGLKINILEMEVWIYKVLIPFINNFTNEMPEKSRSPRLWWQQYSNLNRPLPSAVDLKLKIYCQIALGGRHIRSLHKKGSSKAV